MLADARATRRNCCTRPHTLGGVGVSLTAQNKMCKHIVGVFAQTCDFVWKRAMCTGPSTWSSLLHGCGITVWCHARIHVFVLGCGPHVRSLSNNTPLRRNSDNCGRKTRVCTCLEWLCRPLAGRVSVARWPRARCPSVRQRPSVRGTFDHTRLSAFCLRSGPRLLARQFAAHGHWRRELRRVVGHLRRGRKKAWPREVARWGAWGGASLCVRLPAAMCSRSACGINGTMRCADWHRLIEAAGIRAALCTCKPVIIFAASANCRDG